METYPAPIKQIEDRLKILEARVKEIAHILFATRKELGLKPFPPTPWQDDGQS